MNLAQLYQKASSLPRDSGCYIMRNRQREIIYIGKAKRLRTRVQGYFRAGADHEVKVARMVSQVDDFDVIVTDSEFEALVLECSLIKQHRPKYNILLKDDKGYSWIRIGSDLYPRITVELQKADDDARYIGPYMSAFGIRQLVETACFIFGIPTCTRKFPQEFRKGRPCLNAHIGKCMALCTGKISQAEYKEAIDNAVSLVVKGSKEVIGKMTREMRLAGERLEFERAAKLRDVIRAIEKSERGQKVVKVGSEQEMDVFAFAAGEHHICAVVFNFREGKLIDKDEHVLYDTTVLSEAREEFISHYYIQKKDIPARILVDDTFDTKDIVEQLLSERRGKAVTVSKPLRGENHALVMMAYNNAAERLRREMGRKSKEEGALGELANLLGLASPPDYIEAFDISNYGEEAVAGMVVFKNGQPKRSDYKRFIIKETVGVDDYASMTEAVLRRVNRHNDKTSKSFSKKPDILLLDGGKGHVSVVAAALAATSFSDVPLFGMVKDAKHRTRGIVSTNGELDVAMHKSAFSLIAKIQEETHRFTVRYQRMRHSKTAFRSSLTAIDGIGETRAKSLLKHFKTMEAIRTASKEELSEAPGMTGSAAEAVYHYYRS